MYNCRKLKNILELCIGGNLTSFIENDSLQTLSENALASLHRSPSYMAQPVELIGEKIKRDYSDLDHQYMLMVFPVLHNYSVKDTPEAFDGEKVLCTFDQNLPIERPPTDYINIFYFIFNHELYVILSVSYSVCHIIYKYCQSTKSYSRFLALMNPLTHECDKEKEYEMKKQDVRLKTIWSNVSDKYVYISFGPHPPQLRNYTPKEKFHLLVKVDMGTTSDEPAIVWEKHIMNHFCLYQLVYKECLYSFYSHYLHNIQHKY